MKLKKCWKISPCNFFFKIKYFSTKISQLLDELQKIWKMFWKPLNKCFKISKSSNQKIYQKTSKIAPKIKKQHCITYFTKSEFTLTQLSKLLDKLQKIWNIFGKLLIIALWSVKVQTKKFTGILPEMHQNGFFEKFSFFSKNSIFFSFFSKNQKSEKLPSIN